jgi:hypothetical protein
MPCTRNTAFSNVTAVATFFFVATSSFVAMVSGDSNVMMCESVESANATVGSDMTHKKKVTLSLVETKKVLFFSVLFFFIHFTAQRKMSSSSTAKEIVVEHVDEATKRVAIRVTREATYAAVLATALSAFGAQDARTTASIAAYKGRPPANSHSNGSSDRGELLGCLDELDEHLSLFDAEAQLRREFGANVVFVFDPFALQSDTVAKVPTRMPRVDSFDLDDDDDDDDDHDSDSYSYDSDDDDNVDTDIDSTVPPPLPPDIDHLELSSRPVVPFAIASPANGSSHRPNDKGNNSSNNESNAHRKAATLKSSGSRPRANDLITTAHGDTLFANKKRDDYLVDKEAKAEVLKKKFGARPRTELFAPDAVLARHSQEEQQLHVLKTSLDAQVAAAGSAEHDEFFDKVGQTFKNIDNLPAALRESGAKRAYVREGALRRRVGSQWQERYFYLFSDVLIWVKPKLLSRRVEFKGLAWLDGAVLVAEPLDNELPPASFTLLSGGADEPEAVIVLLCEEAARKSLWTTAIEYLIDRHRREHMHREEQKARVQQRLREKAQLIDAEVSAIEADERRRRERRRRRDARRAAEAGGERPRSPRRHGGGARPSSRNSNKASSVIRQVARKK